jgi:hypothetical protein
MPADLLPLHAFGGYCLGLLVLGYTGLLLGYALSLPCHLLMPPSVALCLLLAVATALYGFLRLHHPHWVYPGVLALAVAVYFLNILAGPYKLRFPDLDIYYNNNRVSLVKHEQEYTRQLREYWDLNSEHLTPGLPQLEAWKQRHATKPTLVVVTVSGGASRSALWVIVVLNRLSQLPGWQHGHVRLITGASGGMLGAAYYVACLTDRGLSTDEEESAPLSLVHNISKDCLTAVTEHWVLRDLPMMLSPFPYTEDRGRALENIWSTNLARKLDVPFMSLQDGEEAGWRPSLVFSPMLVEDGRRLLVSNLDLRFAAESTGNFLLGDSPEEREQRQRQGTPETAPQYPLRPGIHKKGTNLRTSQSRPVGQERYSREVIEGRYALSAVEFFRLFPGATGFQLATATRMSASFPYVSPAVSLPTDPPRRVVDAGYYDNYGVNVAASWIYHYQTWIGANTRGIVLIQIRDSASEQRRLSLTVKSDEPLWWQRGYDELFGPPAGALKARESVMSFRNDEQLQMLDIMLNDPKRPNFFTTVVFERPGRAAMSWYLSTAEAESITQGMDSPQNRGAFTELEAWWKSH